MRELTQNEYAAVFGYQHKDQKKRAELIELFNTWLPEGEHLIPVKGRKLPYQAQEILLYREALPASIQAELDACEVRLGVPFTGGFFKDR